MSENETLTALENMTNEERIRVIETAARLVRSDLSHPPAQESLTDLEERMKTAAEMMRDEYAAGGDLTAFSVPA